MIFVIGGRYSGKREFVKNHFSYGNQDFSSDFHASESVFYGLEEKTWENEAHVLALLRKKKVVICCEVGSGLLPLDLERRLHQEKVGKLCCKLAEYATEVYRLQSGIPSKIK